MMRESLARAEYEGQIGPPVSTRTTSGQNRTDQGAGYDGPRTPASTVGTVRVAGVGRGDLAAGGSAGKPRNLAPLMTSKSSVAITLSNGRGTAWVDACDYDLVRQHRWQILTGPRNRTVYARAGIKVDGSRRQVLLHSLVMGTPPVGMEIDHIDGDGLNNTRSNLRFISPVLNSTLRVHGTTRNPLGCPGVYLDKGKGRWRSVIYYTEEGTRCRKHLGYFSSVEDAVGAYRQALAAKLAWLGPKGVPSGPLF